MNVEIQENDKLSATLQAIIKNNDLKKASEKKRKKYTERVNKYYKMGTYTVFGLPLGAIISLGVGMGLIASALLPALGIALMLALTPVLIVGAIYSGMFTFDWYQKAKNKAEKFNNIANGNILLPLGRDLKELVRCYRLPEYYSDRINIDKAITRVGKYFPNEEVQGIISKPDFQGYWPQLVAGFELGKTEIPGASLTNLTPMFRLGQEIREKTYIDSLSKNKYSCNP